MMTTFAGSALASAIQVPANAAPATPATSAVTSVADGQCGHGHCRHHRHHHCHRRCHPMPPKPGTLSGYQVVSQQFVPPTNTTSTDVVPCPPGKVPLGGGVQTVTFVSGSTVAGSFPASAPQGWAAQFQTGTTAGTFRIFVICAFNH